jgi:multidrug efflux pump subunit AcrB
MINKAKNSFWSFFINRRPVAWLLIIATIIFGINAWTTLPREIQPEINIPFVGVGTVLPGASPADVESLITKPLEDQIANVSDIKTLSSSSNFGFSSIFIEFEASADIDKAVNSVKEAVDLAKSELPEDATDPTVAKAEANSISIITFSVLGNRPVHELTKIAENISDDLEKISGVSQVRILGDQQQAIDIIVDQKKLEAYNLDLQSVSNILKLSNNNVPIGLIGSGKLNYSTRIDNRYTSIEDIENTILITLPGNTATEILLKDIAIIKKTYPPQTVISKVSINGEESMRSVALQVFKKDQGNIIQIADNARAKVEELKENGTIPNGIRVEVTNDNSFWIRTDLGLLTRSGIQTTFLIIIILFLALGFRKGLIAGLSMPIIFLITFIVMQIQGMTINSLSLFALVIALGLMVDTTIIIMEGIHENMKKGMNGKDSAIASVYTYRWPLIAGTMTTVFAFFPMLLVSGILGQFLRTLPLTISAALLASLFVSLTISPSIAARFAVRKSEKKHSTILGPFFEKLGSKFRPTIHFIIQRLWARLSVILGSVLLFALSMALPMTGALKVEMFPQTDQFYFIINIETPTGTVLSETKKITEKVEEYLYDISAIDNFATNIGTASSVALSQDEGIGVSTGASTESNRATITVNLLDKKERELESYIIAQNIREDLAKFTQANILVEEISEGPPSDAPITLRINGESLNIIKEITNDIKTIIQDIPGTTNVKTSLNTGVNEFVFSLDKSKLAYHGLSSIQVSSLIRNIIQGMEIDTITIDEEEIDLFIKYNLPKIDNQINFSIQDIENFEIPSPKGYSVTLSEIGSYQFTESLSSINHEDQKRVLTVTSDLENDINVVDINAIIEEKIADLNIPHGYDIKFGGEFEEINESFRELFNVMLIAIILIAATLVLMFNSFRQAILVILTLPLALIGVFPGLMSIGLALSFPAFLGVIALAGIVVNDAIVLIDRINTNRKNGMAFTDAIAESANARMQPIIMTSITTIVGILPLALTNEFWAGLGFALIFGLAFSTALTLVVIPVLYYRFEIRKARKNGETILN